MPRILGVPLVALLLSIPTLAGSPPDLARLSWLAGAWGAEEGGRRTEEHWLPPRGGVMLGVHREAGGEKKTFFEYLRIEARGEEVFYVASPMGRGPGTDFRLVSLDETSVAFENKEHDFPQRILYRLDENGALRSRIEGPGKDGATVSKEWVWTRGRQAGRPHSRRSRP